MSKIVEEHKSQPNWKEEKENKAETVEEVKGVNTPLSPSNQKVWVKPAPTIPQAPLLHSQNRSLLREERPERPEKAET